MAITITFDELNNGWTSFHSYEPDWMTRLGNRFYTFSGGNLYIHDDGARTSFYNQKYGCYVEFAVNEGPSDIKIFKNLKLETNNSNWVATVNTDLESGTVPAGKFIDKEGFKHAYIRRLSSDTLNFNELSIQGLGNLQEIPTANRYRFTDNIPNQISESDVLYFNDGSTKIVGAISTITDNIITTSTSTNTPSVGNFCFIAKNPEAESFGLRGYFAKVKLTNDSNSFVELFAVDSEVVKSYM